MPSKIAMTMICRDSEATIEECIESFAKDVDFLSITDTGSKDKTKSIISKVCRKAKLAYKLSEMEWIDDFSAARNFSLSFIPPDTDWVCWCDADDFIFQAENLRKLADSSRPELGGIWFPYHYAVDEFGNPCFDEETEVLTNLGWFKFKDVPREASVATLNPEGYLVYEQPLKYIELPFKGQMVRLNHSKQLDLLVTPNHKLYVSKYRHANIYEPYALEEAQNLIGKHFRVKKDAKWKGTHRNFVEIPEYNNEWTLTLNNGHCVNTATRTCVREALRIDTSIWAEFIGYYVSEGSISDRGRVQISQITPHKRDIIWHCLNQLPFKWHSTATDFYCDSIQLATHLKLECGKGAENKRLPYSLKQENPDVLRVMLNAAMLGDGAPDGGTYFTVSKTLADDMQEICLKAGYASNVTLRHQEGHRAPNGIARFPLYSVSILRNHLEPRVNNLNRGTAKLEWQFYEGNVYCFQVPNSVLYVRRHGKACWAGNSTIYERERLLRWNIGWIWRSRVHETLTPLASCQYARTDEVIYKHNHKGTMNRSERNFKLLRLMLKESPEDKRVWLYMGHQHFAGREWSEAAEWYLKFGTDQESLPIERYQALCYCAKALREMKDKQAIDVALMGVELFPNYRDAYLELAHSYLMVGDLDKALHWAAVADVKDLISEPPPIIFINPLEYTFNKYAMLAEIALKKNQLKLAKEYLQKAHDLRPIQDIKNNLAYVDQLERREKVAEGLKALAINLLDNREIVKLESLLAVSPYWFKDLPDYQTLVSGVKHYVSKMPDKPIIAPGDGGVTVNLTTAKDAKQTLEELDKEYAKVSIVCPVPGSDDKQVSAYSPRELEEIITSKEGRHILNLRHEPTRLFAEYDRRPATDLSIRMFLGQGLENWNPETIAKRGCGGSETAAAMICKELAARDCQPILYGMDNQVWDGVIYRQFSNYHASTIPCHLFISSRRPDVFNEDILAKQKWLWLHDIHVGPNLTPEIASKIDAIVCLSKWHAGHIQRVYPFLKNCEVIDMDDNPLTYDDQWTATAFHEEATLAHAPKIVVLGHGLDMTRFEVPFKKVPHRFVWSSAPDRGLEELLNLWPLLIKELPDATLKIFYGWEYFDSSLFIPGQAELKKRILKLIRQPGIEWCGRIGQQQLAEEFWKAEGLIYPPHSFRETYGITFLEAQATNTLCFYRQNGALGETVGDRGIALPMDATPEQIVETVCKSLVRLDMDDILKEGRDYAQARTWGRQAEKMLELYRRLENGPNNGS